MPEIAPKESYSREEVLRLLAISERKLRGWEKNGLIRQADTFAFSDLIALRTLAKLTQDHVPPATIRNAVAALRERLRDIADPLKELKVFADGRRIRVEIGHQHMEAMSGQLLFNFDQTELKRLLTFPGNQAERRQQQEQKNQKETAERWFQRGLELEQTGAVEDAIKAYETAARLDPGSAGALVNLGTIYFNARQYDRAERYYKRALEIDGNYALAHFNIANLYDERNDDGLALQHYKTAILLNPQYADAHYNLALLLERQGDEPGAKIIRDRARRAERRDAAE